jgi:hypothetical protein
MTRRSAILIAVLIAGGCRFAAAPAPEEKSSRLLQACGETDRLLGQMKAAENSFRYDEAGNARISKALWRAIPAPMQESMINAIAYRAICASGELHEQAVTIRSSEDGELLAQQTVTEFDR